MNIAIVGRNIHPPWNEAVKNMAYELALQLGVLGHKVHILTSQNRHLPYGENIVFHALPARGFGRAVLRTLLNLEARDQLDVIHIQNLIIHRSLAPLVWALRRKSRLPIIAYCCQLPSLSFSDWVQVLRTDPGEAVSTKLGMLAPAFVTRAVIRVIDQTVTSSEFLKAELARSKPKNEIEVVPPFIRPDRLSHLVQLKAEGGFPRILYLGSHKALRGQDDFLRILALVKREFPEIEGVAITTFPLPKRTISMVEKLGLSHSVKFLSRGIDLDVPSLLRSSDLYAFTGQTPVGAIDPPLTIIESLILGTPAISYDTGGIREILDETRLIKYQDYPAMAKLACAVLSLDGGRRPQSDLLIRYSSEVAAKRFEEIYNGWA